MKKLFILVISLFVCAGVFQTRVFADDLQDWYDSMPTSVDPVGDDVLYEDQFGKYPNPFILNHDTNVIGKELPNEYIQADDSYSNIVVGQLDTLTFGNSKTKPRSDFAISWAEAICESAEVSYYKRGKGNIDLSEMYLAWSTYNNDGVSTTETGKNIFNIGGNPITATLALANNGFAKEEKFPNTNKESLTNDFVNQHTSNVKTDFVPASIRWYTLKTEEDIVRAKEAVTVYGPIAVPIYLSDEWLRNKKTLGGLVGNSILSKRDIFTTEKLVKDVLGSDTKYEPNYVGLIVGWDDGVTDNSETKTNYNIDLINVFNSNPNLQLTNPNDKYKTWADTYGKPIYWKTFESCQPENNGCWIVKINVSGKDDYYYYSYEDALLSNSIAVGVAMEQVSNDITTYQYDTNTGFNYYDSGKNEVLFYNVFKPQNKEEIDSVGLFTYQNDIQYEINVYATNEDLTLEKLNTVQKNDFYCMKKSGSFANVGYHRISLKGDPKKPEFYNSLDYAGYQDQNIYVIVKYTAPAGKNVLVPINGEAGTYGNVILTSTDETGISNIVIGNEIKDLVTEANAPARIKLFTHSVPNKVTYHLPSDVSMPEDARTFYKDGDEVDFLVDAEKEGYEFFGWYNSDTSFTNDTHVTRTPLRVNGNLDLYPAFKQRVVFDYGDEEGYEAANKNKQIIVNINNYDANGKAQYFEIPTNTVKNGTKEFMGWAVVGSDGKIPTNDGEPVVTMDLSHYSHKFENGILNGADIVCKPVWKTITSTIELPDQEVNQLFNDMNKGEVKYVSAIVGGTIGTDPEDLQKATQGLVNSDKKVILWFESTEISKPAQSGSEETKFDDYKETFEKKLEKTIEGEIKKVNVSKLVDINLFARTDEEDKGTKLPELNKKIELEYDLSGEENKDLREAAEKGILRVSQMHNGEVIEIDPSDVSYDKTTQTIKFKTSQFSIFAFGIAESTPATNPSGETNPSGADTTKSTDNKQEGTNNNNSNTNNVNQNADNSKTTDPNFKTPNTGIY